MSPTALAHALPQSIGGLPLTVVLTVLLGAYLAVGAISTRRAAVQVSAGGEGVAAGSTAAADGAPAIARPGEARPAAGQLVGVLLLGLIIALATLGPADAGSNLTDQFVLSLLWGFVAISSILVGAWWHRVDPMRGLAGVLAIAAGDTEQDLAHPLPQGLATAAAVAGLMGWAWLQLVVHVSVTGFQVALMIYVVVHVAGAARFGVTWLRQVESLNVLSTTLGLLASGDGGPLQRLTAMVDEDRLRWISSALIGWSLVDLLTETERWHDLGGPTWAGTVLLAIAVAALYGLIRGVSDRARLGPAFIAVAGGWVVAHYLSILLIEGQGIPIWLSDPFATGADLLGRRGDLIDPEPLPTTLLAAMQALPFVAGHLAGVVVVQRRAARIVTRPGQLGPATFFARSLIGVLLLLGVYLQLGGV
ncbi:MAG TPA: hypothetical protein VMM13_00890 [Euzebya sp.]|nr:hypothetical protein [Euzebya sp.]